MLMGGQASVTMAIWLFMIDELVCLEPPLSFRSAPPPPRPSHPHPTHNASLCHRVPLFQDG